MKTNQFFKISIIPALVLVVLLTQASEDRKGSHNGLENQSSKNDIIANEVVDAKEPLLSNIRQMTFKGTRSGEGYFSANGEWMIFQSERQDQNPFYQIYLMNMKSGNIHKVSQKDGKTSCAWIHPSMKKVLFSSTHLDPEFPKKAKDEQESRKNPVQQKYSWSFDENFDIFETDFNGKNMKRLTHSLGYDAEASYSPDGKWIAFASNRKGYEPDLSEEDQKKFNQDPSYMMDIYIMKADGSEVKQLTSEKGYDGGPFFSPNGKRITWRRFTPAGDKAEIFTMNVDGSDVKKITDLKSMSWAPFYHPSGDYIVFTSSIYGYSNFELFIIDAEGLHKPVRVTDDEGFDGLPVFTPDGKSLFWSHSLDKKNSQIYKADWDDVMARKLLDLSPKLQSEELNPKITSEDVRKEIYYLASNTFAGRKTGSVEEKVYTSKIQELFKQWGLKPFDGSYLQAFKFTSGVSLGDLNSLNLKTKSEKEGSNLQVLEDFVPLSLSKSGSISPASVIFAGYGIRAPAKEKIPSYDSYKDLNVQGKWVLLFNDIPQDVSVETRLHLVTYSRAQHKLTIAKNEGALGVIFVNGPRTPGREDFDKIKYEGAQALTDLVALKMKRRVVERLFKQNSQDIEDIQKRLDRGESVTGFEFKDLQISGNVEVHFIESQGLNVVGYIETPGSIGSIMVGAHGDHLGRGEIGNSLAKNSEQGQIHYGADDNASGVSGVLELAHYYSQIAKRTPSKLKKKIYFSVWSGEELGNLGSANLLKSHPNFNLEAYVNMDMIGRYRKGLYIQGVDSAKEWRDLIEKVALHSPLSISVESDPYLPTDSLSFYMAGIPTVSFFTGSHAEYHSPRDTPDLISFEKTADVVNDVRELTDELVSTPFKKVTYQKVTSQSRKLQGRSFRLFLGTVPDYTQEGIRGVRISGTSEGSPASKAGLKEKDIIVEFNKLKIDNMYDLVYALQAATPNRQTTIQVLRNDKKEEFLITPLLKE